MFFAILVLLHPTSGHSEIHFYCEIHSEIAEIHVSGIIKPDRINNKLEKCNLINEHALIRETVPLNCGFFIQWQHTNTLFKSE